MAAPMDERFIRLGLETTYGTVVTPRIDVLKEFRKLEAALIRAELERKYGPEQLTPRKQFD